MILTDYYQHRPNDRRRPTKQASPSGQPSFVSPAAWADHCTAYDSRTSHHQPPSPQCSRSLSSLRKSTCIDTVNCF